MKIFKFMRGHVGVFALVMVLLVMQAVAELSLPQYMSDIVDVGVGQGGIPSGVLTSVRAETLSGLELFMDDASRDLVEASYSAPDVSGVRSYVGNPDLLREGSDLAQAMERAEAAWLAVAAEDASGDVAITRMRDAIVSGDLTRAEARAIGEAAIERSGGATDKAARSSAPRRPARTRSTTPTRTCGLLMCPRMGRIASSSTISTDLDVRRKP